jgi:alpha-L-arabinofuranosidase
VRFEGANRAREAKATILTHENPKARNTFDKPDEVKTAPHTVRVTQQGVELNLPKQSIVAIELLMG